MSDQPLVSRPHDFPRMLPAWRDPSFASHELTHVVSPAAPSGVVDGDGAGTPHVRSEAADLTLLSPPPPASVQRAAVTPAAPAAPVAPAQARTLTRTSTESLPVLQLAAVEAPSAPQEAATPVETEPVEPPDDTASAAPESVDMITPAGGPDDSVDVFPDRPLLGTSSPASVASTDTVQDRSSSAAPSVQRSVDHETPRRYGLGAPLRSMPSHSRDSAADAPIQRTTDDTRPAVTSTHVSMPIPERPPNPTTPAPATPNLPAVQRHAGDDHHEHQVDAAPAEPVDVQPGVTPEPPQTPGPAQMPLAHDEHPGTNADHALPDGLPVEEGPVDPAGEPTVARSADPTPTVEVSTLAGNASTSDEAKEPSAEAPTSRPALTLARTSTSTGEPAPTAGPDPGTRTTEPSDTAAPATRPLLGLQRSITPASPPVPAGQAPTTQTSVARTPVRAAGTVQRAPATGETRTPVSSRGPGNAAEIPSGATVPAVSRMAVQRDLASPPSPALEASNGRDDHAGPSSVGTLGGPATLATPVLGRAADPATAPAPAPAHIASAAPSPIGVLARPPAATTELPLARAIDGGASPAAAADAATTSAGLEPTFEPAVPVTVSRALQAGATEVPLQAAEETAPTAPQPAGAPAPAVGGAAASSPEDVEALTQKLLAPMMRRIRAEMLLDRERRGLRTDSRRS